MTTHRSRRESLLSLTIAAAAKHGLDGISLRAIAADAGVSTTAIFQNYTGKAELIAAAARLAASRDAVWHRTLREQTCSVVRGHLGFADFVAAYVELRSGGDHARFLTELLVTAQDHPLCLDTLREWQSQRCAYWADLVALQGIDPAMGAIVADYVLMEEFYAHALIDQVEYRLLLRETSRALCAAAFSTGPRSDAEPGVAELLHVTPLAVRRPSLGEGHPVAGQLLEAAVQIINRSGVSGINQRAIANAVGVSGSMITYHFNDMKNFVTQAIWRALVQDIPVQLDPDDDQAQQPANLSEWLGILDGLLQPVGPERDTGFYVSFSRLTGEACLMARRNPALLPLLRYLRGLEGWGTYRVSRSIAALAPHIARDQAAAFGVWIKAEAILRSAGLADSRLGPARLSTAANLIFASGQA